MIQEAHGFHVWKNPHTHLGWPSMVNLDHLFLLLPAQRHVAEQLATFADYPPRQKPAKFNVEEVLNNPRCAKAAD